MKSISGYVEVITYRNEDNGYTVLTLSSGKKEIKCTGNFGFISEGEYIEIEGEEVFHEIYGEQIKVHSYNIIPATDELSTRKYLGSGAIKGIGAVLASRIVDKFGEDTFRIIEEEPERLAEIRGITMRKAMEICQQVEEKRDMRDVMIFLQGYGISANLCGRIYNLYGNKVYDIIKNNPYQLADDLTGVGFKRADEIARRSGIAVNASVRIKSGMCYTLSFASQNGHMFLPKSKLVEETISILGLSDQYDEQATYNMDMLDHCFSELLLEKKIIVKEIENTQAVYLASFYYTELGIAQKLLDLDISTPEEEYITKVKLETLSKLINVELDENQKDAVIKTQNQGVSIITGGPGTGKTTTINAIIEMFETDGYEVSLAAPTGRAAKRMTEATKRPAKTIHRLLEVMGVAEEGDIDARFGRNEQNPIEADVIIVDEMSMIDAFLMNSLLKAIAIGTKLVLVGDVNQLASVGPGNVLKDIIDSEMFNVVKLTKIYRQSDESGIVVNAHKINEGKKVDLDNKYNDFLYIGRNTPAEALNATIGLIKTKLPKYVDAGELDIQVLTPMRNGILGVNTLNEELQKYINPPSPDKKEREVGVVIFREGDKVMQIKNNYQISWEQKNSKSQVIEYGKGVFNGDMGIITSINNATNLVEVRFDDDKYVIYEAKQLEELELAYAVTVHKSQGSEYPAVVIPLVAGTSMLMTRNLLYTAVTRAKKCVCIVGKQETFQSMILNEDQRKRFSGLKWQLASLVEEQE